MRTRMLLMGMVLVLGIVAPAISQAKEQPTPVAFETVGKGSTSYFRYGDEKFTGADLLIGDKDTWEWFWALHTAKIEPPPEAPAINFDKEEVIVTILGYQTSGGGTPSIRVLEVNVEEHNKRLHVMVEDNETSGPLTVITNPYHIIKFKSQNTRSAVFEHQKP
ncbi:hypothetical protein EG829_11260 [bacterium]|nr:hypothetical protein [bacterium]